VSPALSDVGTGLGGPVAIRLRVGPDEASSEQTPDGPGELCLGKDSVIDAICYGD
jgi:hypothetical protein